MTDVKTHEAGNPARPVVLTIAGSDSSGGAGIQADLKTFAALNTYGASVITSITAQNTTGVKEVHDVPAEVVGAQLDAVLSDLDVAAIKTGMLSNASIVQKTAEKLKDFPEIPIIVDPVMVSKSGHRLLKEDAVKAIWESLFPLAEVITPNLDEVEDLIGIRIQSKQEMQAAAEKLLSSGCSSVLIKGGHFDKTENCIDLLYDGSDFTWFELPRLSVKHTHGTGCTLSSAIAAFLSKKIGLKIAVGNAKGYLHRAMQDAYSLGKGIGPVNHGWMLSEEILSQKIPESE